jgi:hypothetical protein
MQVILSKPIIGYRREFEDTVQDWSKPRTHADAGDILDVIIHNKTNFICDSKYYPGTDIIVLKSQCAEVLTDRQSIDDADDEKFYGVYEEPDEIQLKDDIFDPDELEY